MRKIMAFGTFDLLHPGHLKYLLAAKKLGTHLTVVITTDKNVKRIKGRKPVHSQKERAFLVESLQMVNKAVLGKEKDFYFLIKKFKPTVLALGYDQTEPVDKVKVELEKRNIKARVVVIPAFNEKRHKGARIKERISRQ